MACDPTNAPDSPANLEKFADIIPFCDAMLSEDPTLFDHLYDPKNKPYPLKVVQSQVNHRGVKLQWEYKPEDILRYVRRTIRRGKKNKSNRLLKVKDLPWEIGFNEIQRITRECRRYPKTNELLMIGEGEARSSVNLFTIYEHYIDQYKKFTIGEDCTIEAWQVEQLRSLPLWDTYGINKAYYWEECVEFLSKWLESHEGVPPMVEINKGGFIGLTATKMERLSGFLTTINQQDGRNNHKKGPPRPQFAVSLEKQNVLDKLCAKWGLRWRKDRNPSSRLILENSRKDYIGHKTFIQDSFAKFKKEHKRCGKDASGLAKSAYIKHWFPEYPIKHERQEYSDVWDNRDRVCPPKSKKKKEQDAEDYA